MKRKVGALLMAAAIAGTMSGAALAKPRKASVDVSFQARDAYYSGEIEKAFRLAPRAGERWIAGLAAYRLSKFDEARGFFEVVATDVSEDAWLRSAAAFWAARSATAGGEPEDALPFLRMAAGTPHTFYGMIAERQLALTGQPQFIRMASLAGFPSFGADDHPTPELVPYGGFTLDKALVYAMVRQESRFNQYAVSPVGAVGLMQLMPAAAARAAGDDSLLTNVLPLFDAATNLRLGQDYFQWVLERGGGEFDMMRTLAAYNGGPGTLLKTIERAGPDADTLTIIESLPARETRAYVEHVMAAYWTYRRKFGMEPRTLDAVANGARLIDYRLDQ